MQNPEPDPNVASVAAVETDSARRLANKLISRAGAAARSAQQRWLVEEPRPTGNPLDDYLALRIGSIDGWLSDDVLHSLRRLSTFQQQEGIQGGVAEIGVHHGQLFILLALLAVGDERALAVDLFENQSENVDSSGRGDRGIFEDNLRRCEVPDRVVIEAINSMQLTPELVRSKLGSGARLFSVDGGHTPELTANDLTIASSSLVDGGIIVLDDAFSQMWPGVMQGLWHWFHDGEPGVVPFALVGNKTLLTQPEWAERHRGALAVYTDHMLSREDSLWGHPVTILLTS